MIIIWHKTISRWDPLKNHIFFIYSFMFKLCKHCLGKKSHNKWLNPLLYKQKQTVSIEFNKGRLSHSRSLFKILNASNVYKINFYQHLNFMYRRLNSNIPAIFNYIVKKTKAQIPNKIFELILHLTAAILIALLKKI